MPFQVGDRVKYNHRLGTVVSIVPVAYNIDWDGGDNLGRGLSVMQREDGLEPAPPRPKFQIRDKVRTSDSSETMEVWGINRTTESPGYLYTLKNHTLGLRWVAEEDLVAA